MKVLIIGFGALARSLVNLLCEIKNGLKVSTVLPDNEKYSARNIEIVGIIDVREKALRDATQNSCVRDLLNNDTERIHPGILLDKVPARLHGFNQLLTANINDVSGFLDEINAEIGILSINSFAEKTAIEYSNLLAEHKINLINATPIKIAWNNQVAELFKNNCLGVVGDYVRGYITSIDLVLILNDILRDLGFEISSLYALDRFGGAEGFLLMHEKKMYIESMRDLLLSLLNPLEASYTVDWKNFLKNEKMSSITTEFKAPMGDLELYLSMKINDQIFASLTLLDVIRALKAAVDNGYFGRIEEICQYGFLFTKTYEKSFLDRIASFRKFMARFL